MNLLLDALAWLTDAAHWSGSSGIPTRMAQHVVITLMAVLCASCVAIPLGIATGHSKRGSGIVVGLTGAARAIPTLGLLTLFGLAFGIGVKAPLLALIVLAIPSLLAGTYAGIQAVDSVTVDAAQAIGMSTGQVIRGVELPLALPVIIGGIRAATLQVVSTTTLAAYTSDYGLGRYLFIGLKTRDYAVLLGGAILVIVLALLFEACLAAVQRAATRAVTHVK